MQWPHEILPTDSLVYTNQQSTTAPITGITTTTTTTLNQQQQHSLSSLSSSTITNSNDASGTASSFKKLFPVSHALDEATGKRILEYHYNRREKGGSRVTEARSSSGGGGGASSIPINKETRFAESFYVPKTSGTAGSKPPKAGALDVVTDYLSWATGTNLITKAWLIENEYTVRELLMECEVKMSEMVSAGILTSIGDLLQLRFRVEDLKYAPELFSCADLKRLFGGANARTLENAGLAINIVQEPHFYAQDLIVLDYSLGDTIMSGGINKMMLHSLNYAPSDLYELGVRKTHLNKLKISRNCALRPRDHRDIGFGWSESDLSLFT